MFETEPFAIPSKWSAKPKFIQATNHIQQCLATELQKRAEDLLEARVAKGPPVVSFRFYRSICNHKFRPWAR